MSSKDKYDRQLRLWGPEGQRRLANSHVLLIQASSCGTEVRYILFYIYISI